MATNWNGGMDYGFSTIKSMMQVLGLWPLQQNGALGMIQWLIIFTVESLTMINVLIEPFKSCGIPRNSLEIVRLIESSMHGWINIVFPRIYMRKIAVNVSSAIHDWSSLSVSKESRAIMMAYARVGRMVALIQLIAGSVAGIVWFMSVFLGNKQEVVIIDNETMNLWTFVLPSTCLYKDISYSTYKVLFVVQIIQGTLILISECACDSFFFGITMHLCGQLELLRIRFNDIGKNYDSKKRSGNILGPLIKRYCQLITLAKNIDDAFNINILLRILIISVVIATSGVGFIVSFRRHDHKEMMKMLISIQFYMVQTYLFTHAGDTLQSRSESMVHTIYCTKWYELSPARMKDLILVMMRMRVPLRLSAGRFFYLTRTTMTDILKTTLTYVSFLQYTAALSRSLHSRL